ncbi:MAG: hypothetical protein C0508_07000 [Cyanobacteria bacterium PR.023]|nr:hypothetical protein [Cyanobacteria bacterium PR.023]
MQYEGRGRQQRRSSNADPVLQTQIGNMAGQGAKESRPKQSFKIQFVIKSKSSEGQADDIGQRKHFLRQGRHL